MIRSGVTIARGEPAKRIYAAVPTRPIGASVARAAMQKASVRVAMAQHAARASHASLANAYVLSMNGSRIHVAVVGV